MSIALVIALTILIISLWHFGYIESYRSCRSCPGSFRMDKNAMLNPFIWPYSGRGNPNLNNAEAQKVSVEHLNVPDHEPTIGYGD